MNEKPPHQGAARWKPPAPEHLETMLAQYDQWEMLGCGGMGAVYKARQISLDRLVAIKVLPPQVAEGEAEYIERFKNEARTMARMNHPAIVGVYDFGETSDELLYIVMEYIDGTDVAKMIQTQGKLPVEHALAITVHVCDALAYAHEHGVVHRDIKPANILINMEGAVKVADFGLARMNDPNETHCVTKEGTTMGTPDYVAPEVLIIGMSVDGRADLYAVGVMLYNMLTGRIPRGNFLLPSERIECDPRYDTIVRKALEQDVERRYQTSREFRRDLDQILTTPIAKVEPEKQTTLRGMMPRLPPPPPPQAGIPWGMIASAIIVIGGAAVFLTRRGESPPPAPAPKVSQTEPARQQPARFTPEVEPARTPHPVPVDPNAPKGSPLSHFPVLTHNGHHYQVVGERMNQSNAQKHAQGLGAHLATINSQQEQDWMGRSLSPFLLQVLQSMASVGGVRENGVWKWVTDEPFDFTRWEDAPDPASEPAKNFALKITARSATRMEWGLGNDNTARAFVLEWDPPAPPQPVTENEGVKRLRELETSFQAALERDVLTVYHTALADLNTKYLAALERALSAAAASAHLPEALSLREEKQRIISQTPLPVDDAPDLPASLKTLRSTYRSSLRPIITTRDSALAVLILKYEEVLKAQQAEWSKASKPEEAGLAGERIAKLTRERETLVSETK